MTSSRSPYIYSSTRITLFFFFKFDFSSCVITLRACSKIKKTTNVHFSPLREIRSSRNLDIQLLNISIVFKYFIFF